MEGKGFVVAKRLARSDLLQDADGRRVAVAAVTARQGDFAAYNFEVENTHTYFAGGGWVHNTCSLLGVLRGKSARVTQKGLEIVEQHVRSFGHADYNEAMLARVRQAMTGGQSISGADLSFYLHELNEATRMRGGVPYPAAHQGALQKYSVSPFSLYHPDVISALSSQFNDAWRSVWGIK